MCSMSSVCATVARELGVQVERLAMSAFGKGEAAARGTALYPKGVKYGGQEENVPIGEWLRKMGFWFRVPSR